jgi:hypothetical protein
MTQEFLSKNKSEQIINKSTEKCYRRKKYNNVMSRIFLHAIISLIWAIIACQISNELIYEILYWHAIIRPKNYFLGHIS